MAAVSGNVKHLVGGAALRRLVRVFRLSDAAFIGASISDQSTGAWSVTVPDSGELYFAIMHDLSGSAPASGVVLYISGAGTNGSTNITDSTGKAVTVNGNAQITTGSFQVGASSIALDGAGDFLSVAPSASDLDLGQYFEISLRFRYIGTANTYPVIISNHNGSWSAGAVAINVDASGYTDKVKVGCYDFSSSGSPLLISSSSVVYNTWNTLRLIRDGKNFLMLLNDVLESVGTFSGSFNVGKNALLIGGGGWDGANSYFAGNLQDIMIQKHSASRLPYKFRPGLYSPGNYGGQRARIIDRLVPQ